jgi:aryl-alcohol dehydrogenase-like predicted oxidoreductase
MQYRRFGRTGLNVSVMGLGSGGPSLLGQRSGVPEAEAHRVVHRALDLGINLIDTAAGYIESEAILGRALHNVPRDSYVLCSKFSPGRRIPGTDQFEFRTGEELIASCERSLQRLGTDYLDLLQFHAVLPETYPHTRDVLIPVMRRLQEQGKVRFMGISDGFEHDHRNEALQMALADDLFDTLMVGYNLLTPAPEHQVLDLALRQDVGVLIMCAVRRRIGRPADLEALIADLKQQGELPDAVPDRDPLAWLIHGDVTSVTDAAYKFAAGHPAVSTVLTGTANVQHLEANVRAILGDPLPTADREQLKAWFGPIGRNLGN